MPTNHYQAWLVQKRKVRFGDTDGAGVMHFHQIFRWAHEAWEESIECYGISKEFIFPSASIPKSQCKVFLPIIHCEASFRKPIHVGEELIVKIKPLRLNLSSFQIQTDFNLNNEVMATALISHMAISPDTRKKCELPNNIHLWLEASSISQGPSPV